MHFLIYRFIKIRWRPFTNQANVRLQPYICYSDLRHLSLRSVCGRPVSRLFHRQSPLSRPRPLPKRPLPTKLLMAALAAPSSLCWDSRTDSWLCNRSRLSLTLLVAIALFTTVSAGAVADLRCSSAHCLLLGLCATPSVMGRMQSRKSSTSQSLMIKR